MWNSSSMMRSLCALGAVAFLTACPGDDADRGGPADAEDVGPAVDPETAGTVTGTVVFEGSPPQGRAIDMSEEPACAEKHDEQPRQHDVVVGGDGGLGNVFVYVKEGLPERRWPAADREPELDQEGCEYHPRVLGVQTGQSLTVRNSDGLLHNVNAKPTTNRGFNISQPREMTTTRTFTQPEVMIPVDCDVHGWMHAYIAVLEHPYFAVTDESGSFRIENLPAGDYVIETWHERYGTQTMNVTVAAREDADASFTYSEAMAAGAVVPLGEPLHLHGPHAAGTHSATLH